MPALSFYNLGNDNKQSLWYSSDSQMSKLGRQDAVVRHLKESEMWCTSRAIGVEEASLQAVEKALKAMISLRNKQEKILKILAVRLNKILGEPAVTAKPKNNSAELGVF